MAQRVYNYEIAAKLDTMLQQQHETMIAVARVEERLIANSDKIKVNSEGIRNNRDCIDKLQASEKRWGGVASILGVISGFITGMFAR